MPDALLQGNAFATSVAGVGGFLVTLGALMVASIEVVENHPELKHERG